MWGELVLSKILNPPFPVLKAGHSVSYSCICDVCREWVNEVGFFLVWLVCYAHGFHVSYLPQFLLGRRVFLEQETAFEVPQLEPAVYSVEELTTQNFVRTHFLL